MFTNLFICLSQIGICAAYLTFAAVHFQQTFDFACDHSVHWYMSVLLPFFLVCVSIRHLKYISILAYLGSPAQMVCLGIVFYYIFQTTPDSRGFPAFAKWETLPLAFGSIMFSFEAITLVLPIENRTRNPSFFLAWNGVLISSSLLVTFIYLAFAFFGYLRYGDGIQDSITLNLPQGEPLSRVIKGSIAVAVALSYPLQHHVPMEMLANTLKEKYRTEPKKRMLIEYGCRYAMTLLIYGLAMVVSSIGLIISVVGALTGTTLSLIIPPAVDLIHLYGERTMAKWFKLRVVVNILVVIYGLIGLISGTAVSVYDIVKAFQTPET